MGRVRGLLLLATVTACGHAAVAKEPLKTKPDVPTSSVADISTFCDQLARVTDDAARRRLFATISETGEPAPWREYASDDELRNQLQAPSTYEVAELWRREDGAVLVETTATSDSGDWANFVHYCYRPNGSLARTQFTMNSFVLDDGIRGIRVRYFTTDGRQLLAESQTRDLETDAIRAQLEFDEQEPLYKTVSAVPFAALLR